MATVRALAVIAAVFALGGTACAQCLDGDYMVAVEPLLPGQNDAFAGDVVTIAGDTVAIGACPAVAARIRSTSRGIVVRAVWSDCGTVAERVRLRAVVSKPCKSMRGRLVTRRPRTARRFVAAHGGTCEPDDARCHTCRRNADCGPDRYCVKAPGDCTAGGICEPRPAACPLDIQPVCGCDGVTYTNRCDAAANGVSVASHGPCPTKCGTIAGIPCPDDQFCDLEPSRCAVTDLGGECVPIPEACALYYAPVCGCDGVTYGNDCERQAAQAQKAHDGRCANPEPRVCGGIAGIPCGPDEFCELPKGECQLADAQGVCVPVPKLCPDLYAPVCGCDGTTYSNDCERQMAGVQFGHEGPCGAPCDTACDCAKAPLPERCALMLCPACACGWVCERGHCAAEVFTPSPPPLVCG